MVRIFRKIKECVPIFTWFALVFSIFALICTLIANGNTSFANTFNSTVSASVRTAMAYLTSWIPFSLAEFMLLTSPVLVAIVIAVVIKKSLRGTVQAIRACVGLFSLIFFVLSFFYVSFGIGYRTDRLDKRIGLEKTKVSAEELYETVNILIDKLNEVDDSIVYVEGRGSLRPYSHEEAVKLCRASYTKLHERYPFIGDINVPVKQIVLSELMTYTHISGVFTCYTGEANLNTNYPNYVRLYTTAHEMAHQRGITREDEANFIAFLVCIESPDEYMQYAGYLNMLEYFLSPLYSASKEYYREALGRLDKSVLFDMQCYSDFFEKYKENVAAEVSSTVNNNYLVSQGTEGEKSYGMVVDLTVAYYRDSFK